MINCFLPLEEVTADYTITSSDHSVVCNSSSSITITLPDIPDCGCLKCQVLNIGSGTVSFSENINNKTMTLSQDEAITLHPSGSKWYAFSKSSI